jgi:molybdopterin-guanine dinucleotide biosynthesis protein A
MVKNITGVILAGGANKRFHGTTKAKIVIDGKTIISRILDTIGDIFPEIIIVTNNPEEFKEFTGYKLAGDYFINAGPLGGIHTALKTSSNEDVFVFAGDMPLLDKKLIVSQINFYYNSICDTLVPQFDENIEPLHAIYNMSVLNKLEKYLSGDRDYAVREFLKSVNVKYMKLENSEKIKNAFTNINSPSDISLVEKILGIP